MSPAGIPMFYGSFDNETALLETRTNTSESCTASIATFELMHPMQVLDLTQVGKVPSIFDPAFSQIQRETRRFLRQFIEEVSKSVKKDLIERVEYVPTQVFTEFIRHIFDPSNGMPVMGIVYPSAVSRGKASCVLFLENEHCCDAMSAAPIAG
jgi:hypothetical protein